MQQLLSRIAPCTARCHAHAAARALPHARCRLVVAAAARRALTTEVADLQQLSFQQKLSFAASLFFPSAKEPDHARNDAKKRLRMILVARGSLQRGLQLTRRGRLTAAH